MIIRINDREIHPPQHWNDLPKKQLLQAYGILMTDSRGLFDNHELVHAKRIVLMKMLLDLDDAFMEEWKQDRIDEHGEDGNIIFLSELKEMLAVTDFLFDIQQEEEEALTYAISLNLTKNPFPQLSRTTKHGKEKILYAPADKLDNISLYELGRSFSLFEAFIKSGNEDYANELIATLYRPHKPKTSKNKRSAYQGDIRLPLLHHEGTVKKRQKHIAILPPAVKQIILFWFASCRQYIVESFPKVFVKSEGDESASGGYGWSGVIMSLAGGIIHLDEVAGQRYSNAMAYLSYLEDERLKQKLNNSPIKQ